MRRFLTVTLCYKVSMVPCYLQEPNSWVLIDTASAHSSPIPGESFVDRHSACVPRMPRVTDFSRFKTMGVALSTYIMRTVRISDLRRGRLKAEFVPKLRVEFFRMSDSEGCTIVTIERHSSDRLSTYPL